MAICARIFMHCAPPCAITLWTATFASLDPDQSFVAVADVNEPELTATFGRVHPAVDALDRVVVAFDAKLENYEQNQVLARVLALTERQ